MREKGYIFIGFLGTMQFCKTKEEYDKAEKNHAIALCAAVVINGLVLAIAIYHV